ncbi:MAG: chemotaxis protein CheW, partial [Pseudobdellovibrionaceae bacterium]
MKFLNFILDSQHFGIDLKFVREVIAFPEISKIPSSSKDFLGVTNLRGQIIPIYDLRIKFEIEPTLTYDTAVIICELQQHPVGIVVDVINNVVAPKDEDISELPLSDDAATDAVSPVSHIVKHERQIVVLVNMSKIISSLAKDISKIKEVMSSFKDAA